MPDSAKYDTYSLLTRNCTTHKETSVIQPEHPQRNDVVVGIENIVLHNIGILNIGDLLPFFVPSTDLKRVSVYKKDRPAAGRKLTYSINNFLPSSTEVKEGYILIRRWHPGNRLLQKGLSGCFR